MLHVIFDRMKQSTQGKNITLLIIWVLAAMLLSVNIIRIFTVSITHDEALTYQWYVTHSYGQIITNHIPTANNHFLNSVLAKLSIELFADNLFFLRLPSLLAHITYLLLSVLVARRLFSKDWWVLFCFMMLQLNPFMFEFFGLSRGYALSITCMLAALLLLLRYLDAPGKIVLTGMYICLFLAVFSNFALLNVVMAFSGIICLHWWQRRKQENAAGLLIWMIFFTGVILLAVYEPLRILEEKDQLYFGGQLGFVQSTLKSLIGESLFLPEENNVGLYLGWLVAIAVLVSGLYWLWRAYDQGSILSIGLMLWLLLVIPAFSTITQHLLLGNKFLIERTALFFYPLFSLYITYTFYHAALKPLIIIVLILLSVNFLKNTSLSATRTWEYDSHDKFLLDRMIQLKKDDGEIKIYLDGYFTPAFRYRIPREYPEGTFGYIEGHNERAYDWQEYDYCLIRKEEVHKIPDHFVLDTVVSRLEFHLYRRKD